MVISRIDTGNEWEREGLGERIMTSFLDKLLGSFQLPKSKNPQTKREYTQHCKRCGILIKIHVCSELAKKTISASTHSDLTMRPQQFQLLYSGLLLRGKTTILCLVILPCSGFSLWFYFVFLFLPLCCGYILCVPHSEWSEWVFTV